MDFQMALVKLLNDDGRESVPGCSSWHPVNTTQDYESSMSIIGGIKELTSVKSGVMSSIINTVFENGTVEQANEEGVFSERLRGSICSHRIHSWKFKKLCAYCGYKSSKFDVFQWKTYRPLFKIN